MNYNILEDKYLYLLMLSMGFVGYQTKNFDIVHYVVFYFSFASMIYFDKKLSIHYKNKSKEINKTNNDIFTDKYFYLSFLSIYGLFFYPAKYFNFVHWAVFLVGFIGFYYSIHKLSLHIEKSKVAGFQD